MATAMQLEAGVKQELDKEMGTPNKIPPFIQSCTATHAVPILTTAVARAQHQSQDTKSMCPSKI
eukprot:10052630-Ditylum_brightwellii.AAC.2